MTKNTEIEILHAETREVVHTCKKIQQASTHTGISKHVVESRLNQKMIKRTQDVFSTKLGHRVLFKWKGKPGVRRLRKMTPEEQAQRLNATNNESNKDLLQSGQQVHIRQTQGEHLSGDCAERPRVG